jgi:hypothetical protein
MKLFKDHTQLRLCASEMAADIAAYVAGSIETKVISGELLVGDRRLHDTIVKTLVSKADGMQGLL